MNWDIAELTAVVMATVAEFGMEGPNGPTGATWWESQDYERIAAFLHKKGLRKVAS